MHSKWSSIQRYALSKTYRKLSSLYVYVSDADLTLISLKYYFNIDEGAAFLSAGTSLWHFPRDASQPVLRLCRSGSEDYETGETAGKTRVSGCISSLLELLLPRWLSTIGLFRLTGFS